MDHKSSIFEPSYLAEHACVSIEAVASLSSNGSHVIHLITTTNFFFAQFITIFYFLIEFCTCKVLNVCMYVSCT